jgi:hypothetical protein
MASLPLPMRRRRNCDDSKDACASATGDDTASYEAATHREAEAAHR